MDPFHERLIVRAATIDELLSDEFETLPGQKGDADVAAKRLAAWCRSCASGDWSLFARRLERDGLSIGQVLERFATVRRKVSDSRPAWADDAIWIEAALQSPAGDVATIVSAAEPRAFEHLLAPVVEQAEARLWAGIDPRAFDNLNESARACLRFALLEELCNLCAPAIYERFVKARKAAATPAQAAEPRQDSGLSLYDRFVADMKGGGFRQLFEDKPVLLRVIATITRQWIDTSREFVMRLDADLAAVGRDLLHSPDHGRVAKIEGDLSDPHNGGHSVQIVCFEDGSRAVYKPKDLRLDAAWYALVERLNRAGAPVEIKAVRTIVRDGYGWTEFIENTGCADQDGFKWFFQRAGAWLALFHCFAGTDMHQENMIAAGDHPVPIDMEMILQAISEENKDDAEGQASEAAIEIVANSVMMVGLLPSYGRSPDNNLFAVGGMAGEWNAKTILEWSNINSDTMRPAKTKQAGVTVPNLPHVDGRSAKFGDYVDDLVSGFADYAAFLLRRIREVKPEGLLGDFAGLPVRKVIRPTRFYYMLLQRLRNHRTMDDGVAWSAQADFIARLADWDKNSDLIWPLQQAERSALVALNVPHFISPSDGKEIRDAAGISIQTDVASGLERARVRVESLDEEDIGWQIEVIRQNTMALSTSLGRTNMGAELKPPLRPEASVTLARETFIAEADDIAEEVSRHAIRRGPGAAWIGLDWLGDSEVSQLVCLGPDLYNGVSGIALFLAAHASVTQSAASRELAFAGLALLRKNLKSKTSARMARSLGTGGASGVGSVVYTLTVMSRLLRDEELLADAHAAAALFTDDLIAADKQLDIMGGSAGGILALLRLNRDSPSADVLRRAIRCGEHLLGQPRFGPQGRASWKGQGLGEKALNGMSHGAAGFAYALASLSVAAGREDFAKAAQECIAFEDSSYDAVHKNWPDFRVEEASFLCQWCHGATGIGLARIASTKRGGVDSKLLIADVERAVGGVEQGWTKTVDTLCCGSLGNIEFMCEAGDALGRPDLRDRASRYLKSILEAEASTGDFRWSGGKRRFNLGLFRGLSGVGYTFLRQVDRSLPNVLIWE